MTFYMHTEFGARAKRTTFLLFFLESLFLFLMLGRIISLTGERISIFGALKKSGRKQHFVRRATTTALDDDEMQDNKMDFCSWGSTPYHRPSSKHGLWHTQSTSPKGPGTGLRSVSQGTVPQHNLPRQRRALADCSRGGRSGFHTEMMLGHSVWWENTNELENLPLWFPIWSKNKRKTPSV